MGKKNSKGNKKRIWLKIYREILEYTQIELAKAVGVSNKAISYYELGVMTPTEENAKKIGDLLGFDENMFYRKGVI